MDKEDDMDRRTLTDLLHGGADWLRVRLGLPPRCAWIQGRFGGYFRFELGPAELRAVERHLRACPHCARAWRETEPLLEELEALTPLGRQLQASDEEAFMAGLWEKIDAAEAQAERERDKVIILRPRQPQGGLRGLLVGRPRLAAAPPALGLGIGLRGAAALASAG